MNIIYDFIAQSMQDKRALVNYLLTMGFDFIYISDTGAFSVSDIDDTTADKIAFGARSFGASEPIKVEADYLPF